MGLDIIQPDQKEIEK